MNRIILTVIFVQLTIVGFTQPSNEDLISLAKIYRSYHFSNTPSQQVFQDLLTKQPEELKTSGVFLAELIKSGNSITSKKYLTKPDQETLEHLFVIRSINWNLAEADPMNNNKLIDSLRNSDTEYLELLACYYNMIWVSVANKNQPLQMADTNFDLNDYGLENDTEKGLFFLVSMRTLGQFIWGYMNVVKPPNYKKALEKINEYPSFNSAPYYQYQYLNFPDFKLTVDKREPKKSFKEHYINKYLNTLLYHSMCLSQKRKYQDEKDKVMLGSIMKNDSYYKYSENPEIFRKIFKRIDE